MYLQLDDVLEYHVQHRWAKPRPEDTVVGLDTKLRTKTVLNEWTTTSAADAGGAPGVAIPFLLLSLLQDMGKRGSRSCTLTMSTCVIRHSLTGTVTKDRPEEGCWGREKGR